MKKIIFIFIVSLTLIINTQALSKFYLGEKVPNMKTHEYTDYESHTGIPFVLRREDGVFTYCLNPFLKINTTDYYQEYTYNNSLFNISDKALDKMNLIAYYGYGYQNHTDLKWYGVTQFLIWKSLGMNDIYFVDVNNLNRVDTYDNEIKEIEDLVNEYYLLPNISKKLEYTINTTYEEFDLNGVLDKYEIVESDIDSKIENNKLIINTKEPGNYKIRLIRKSPIDEDYKIYYIEGSQPLLLPGRVNDIEFTLDIEVISGSVEINKKDSEDINRVEANLEGAIYGLYNEEELITTLKTDSYGNAYLDNLPLGKYYIKELTPSLGYMLDDNIYEFSLTKDNKNIVIESKEEVIKGNLVINKYYKDDIYKLEDGAVFDIYNINNELVENIETKNGIANLKLDYGYYYIIQTKGLDGYKLIDKFDLNIKNSDNYIYNLYDDPILEVEVPNTKKMDYYRFLPLLFILAGVLLIIKSKKCYS